MTIENHSALAGAEQGRVIAAAPSWWQQVRMGLRLLWNPPDRVTVHTAYTHLRQEYVLSMLRDYFQKRADDPVPLYQKTVLDVGCGLANLNGFLSLSGAKVTSLDPQPEILQLAMQQATGQGVPVTFVQSTLEDFTQPNTPQYDVILALDVLEHVENPARFVWSLQQLLKPNGVIVLSTINRTFKAWVLHILCSQIILGRTQWGSIRRFFRPQQVRTLLRRENLTALTVQGLWFDPISSQWHLAPTPDTRFIMTVVRT